jgi:hypothetical protein
VWLHAGAGVRRRYAEYPITRSVRWQGEGRRAGKGLGALLRRWGRADMEGDIESIQ